MKTVPTLLTTSIQEFEEQMVLFQKYYQRIQLDIADGNLVPNVTTSIDEILELLTRNPKLVHPSTVIDFHLMVQDYKADLEKIVMLQEKNVNVNLTLVNARLLPNVSELANSHTFSIGLDIHPNDSIDTLARHYDLATIPSVQIMTVNPGFQGSPFLPEMLTKITQLREQHYTGEILIDGGVNNSTIPVIQNKKYMPDVICIGSFLTKSGEKLEERVKQLHALE